MSRNPSLFVTDGPDWPNQRGSTSRRTLPCGCVEVTYSSPDIPFGRSATEKYCKLHKSRKENLFR